MHTVARQLAVVMAVGLAGCGTEARFDENEEGGAASGAALSEVTNQTDWAKGTRWTYEASYAGFAHAWVYRPASLSKKKPNQRGLVLHLIGCGEVAYQVAQGSGWPQAAEAAGLVVVIPEILSPSHPNGAAPNTACYNYGTNTANQPTRTSTDHKAIIAAPAAIAAKEPGLAIDPAQVYVAGLSAGAAVAMQVGCMAPDVFAGVISVAGPAIGSDQSQAVMPPKVTSSQISSSCQSYAKSSSVANPTSYFAQQLYVIVSDDNGLPAGNPVYKNGGWTADKFEDQTIWDGDKYVPHAYHDLITGAMAGLLGVSKSGSKVVLPYSGNGTGCAGGEKSHDDTAETSCTFAKAVGRSWKVTADQWTDSKGLMRLVHLEQDTLRHRWPAGPVGQGDAPVYPDRQYLKDNGYFGSDGQFDMTKVDAAPNGTLGVLFFATDAFDLPMFLADFLAANNPRLPAAPPTDPTVTATATLADDQSFVTVKGTATAQGSAVISTVKVTLQGATSDATFTSGPTADFSATLTTAHLDPGTYTVSITATDDQGHAGSTTASFTLRSAAGSAPVLAGLKASVASGTLTVTGTASDADGNLSSVGGQVSVAGATAKLACSGTSSFTCTLSLTGVAAGTYTATVTATDSTNLASSADVSFTVATAGQCVTATNTKHIAAKRATSGGSVWAPKAYAVGSNDDLGYAMTYFDQTSSVQETSPGFWKKVSSCP